MSGYSELEALSRERLDEYAAVFLDALDGSDAKAGAADALAAQLAKALWRSEDAQTPETAQEKRGEREEKLLSAGEKLAAVFSKAQDLFALRHEEKSEGQSFFESAATGGAGRKISGENALLAAAQNAGQGEADRRYENTVGRRRLEMSRVSDYFRRDSRRYDSGFDKY